MSNANEALFVVRLPVGTKTVPFTEIQKLVGIALYEARHGCFDEAAATEDDWLEVHIAGMDYENLLAVAAGNGVLEVLNNFTLRRLEIAAGAMLKNGVVTVGALRKFLESHNGTVDVAVSEGLRLTPEPPPPPLRTVLGNGDAPMRKRQFAAPNWDVWRVKDVVALWEAACLAANVEPPKDRAAGTPVWASEIYAEFQLDDFPSEFQRIWAIVNSDLALREIDADPVAERMFAPVYLAGFAHLLIKKQIPVPNEFREIAFAHDENDSLSGHTPNKLDAAPDEANYPWTNRAREIGRDLHKKFPRLSVDQLAERTREKMVDLHKSGAKDCSGRGGRVPAADTIKRHALSGIKN